LNFLKRYILRPFEILIKGPLRWMLGGILPCREPLVFYGYERIPNRDEPAAGGIVKLQDLSERFPNRRWRANRLYLISSCYPWTVRWQVRCARLFGARILLNQNGLAYPAWKPDGWQEENERARWLYERADGVVFQSDFCRRSAETYLGPCQVSSQILLNPVDLDRFAVPDRKERASKTILLAGTHQFAYRVRGALETMASLNEKASGYRLLVCGRYRWREEEKDSLEEALEWAKQLGVAKQVEFRGAYTQEELPGILAEADLLLHTKVMDPCPRLVAEALAAGLPVVYPSSGGLPEMVSAEAGIGIPSNENYEKEEPSAPADFATAIQTVSEKWKVYSQGARHCAVERFDRSHWLAAHETLFCE